MISAFPRSFDTEYTPSSLLWKRLQSGWPMGSRSNGAVTFERVNAKTNTYHSIPQVPSPGLKWFLQTNWKSFACEPRVRSNAGHLTGIFPTNLSIRISNRFDDWLLVIKFCEQQAMNQHPSPERFHVHKLNTNNITRSLCTTNNSSALNHRHHTSDWRRRWEPAECNDRRPTTTGNGSESHSIRWNRIKSPRSRDRTVSW